MDEVNRIQAGKVDVRSEAKIVQRENVSPDSSFQQYLAQVSSVRFSSHAQKRLENRSIEMNPDRMTRLEGAVEKASARGSKESLILMDELAFIVNIRERMVVTTMDMSKNKNGVFTQIDSVVIADGTEE
jgi:flagellar operon protein